MAQQFIALPLPVSGDGPGAAVAVPAASPHKTVAATGTWSGMRGVALEISTDGVKWATAAFFSGAGAPARPITFSAPFARVNVYRGLGTGTPVLTLAIDTVTGSYQQANLPLDGTPVDVSAFENKHKTVIVSGATDQNLDGQIVVYASGDGVKYVALFVARGSDTPTFLFDGFVQYMRALPAAPPLVPAAGNTAGMQVSVCTEPFECGEAPAGDCAVENLPLTGGMPDEWVAGPNLISARSRLLAAVTKLPAGFRALFIDGTTDGVTPNSNDVDGYAWDGTVLTKDATIPTPSSGDPATREMTTAITRDDCDVTIPMPTYTTGSPEDPPIQAFQQSAKIYDPNSNSWVGSALANPLITFGQQEPAVGNGASCCLIRGPFGSLDPNEGTFVCPGYTIAPGVLPSGEYLVKQGSGAYTYSGISVGQPVGPTYPVSTGIAICAFDSNTRVMMCGGGFMGAVATSAIYDAGLNTWSYTGDMNVARTEHQLVVLDSGKILAVGGQDSGGLPIASCEVWDPGTNLWTLVGSLPSPRFSFSLVKLPDGNVMVIGGQGPGFIAVGSTAVFDKVSQIWTVGPPLLGARAASNAVVIPSDVQYTVVVAGGFDQLGASLDTCEYLHFSAGALVVDDIEFNEGP